MTGGFVVSSHIEKVGKCVALAGAITTVSDVCQPIAPFAAWVVVVSALALILLYFIRPTGAEWGEYRSIGLYFSISAFLLSSVVYLFQGGSEESKSIGVLAANSSAVQRIQGDLGLINAKLEEISKKLDNVKKEVSDDPKKELANKGLPWKYEKFLESMYDKDYELVELYARGGMSVRNDDFSMYMSSLWDSRNSEILLKNKAFVDVVECPAVNQGSGSYAFYLEGARLEGKKEVIASVCKGGNIRRGLDGLVDLERARYNEYQKFDGDVEGAVKYCARKLMALDESYYSENYFSKYAIGFIPRDRIENATAAKIFRDRVSRSSALDEFSVMLANYSAEVCRQEISSEFLSGDDLNSLEGLQSAVMR